MNKIDPRLVEIFEYNFGIDLTEQKYQSGLYELSQFFGDTTSKAVADFYSPKLVIVDDAGELQEETQTPGESTANPNASQS